MTHDEIIAARYSRAQIKAAHKAAKLAERGREAKVRGLLAEHDLRPAEADWIVHGTVPSFTDTGLALIGGFVIGAEHPMLLDALLVNGITLDQLRIAEAVGQYKRYANDDEWLADPLVIAALEGVVTGDRVIASAAPAPVVDRGPTDAQLDAMWEAATCRDTGGSPTDVQHILDAAGASLDDFERAFGAPVEPANPVPVPADNNPTPTQPNTKTIGLPGHWDIADPVVRARVETDIVEQFGAASMPVVMWPRDPVEGTTIDVPIVIARPRVTRRDLGSEAKSRAHIPNLLKQIAADDQGELVEFDLYQRVAWAAHLTPLQIEVRDVIASHLKQQVNKDEIEVAVYTVDDRIDQVVVLRAPMDVGKSTMEREQDWRLIISKLPTVDTAPGAANGWLIDDDKRGVTRLVWGPRPQLPEVVNLLSMMRAVNLSTTSWNLLPLGVRTDGQIAGIDLATGPHTLFAGGTGAGKTITMLTMIVAALTRSPRFEVHIMDPNKGVDFNILEPFVKSFAKTMPQALAQIRALDEERERRKQVLTMYKAQKWADLTPEQQHEHGIYPILLVADEYEGLVEQSAPPKGVPKDDPEYVEIEQANQTAGRIAMLMAKHGRESRYVGIFLEIGTQRSDADVLGGRLRNNLPNKINLFSPSRQAGIEGLRMVYGNELAPMAMQMALEVSDGRPGIAIGMDEYGVLTAFRSAYAEPHDMPGILRQLGVPEATDQWDLEAMAEAARVPEEGEVITPRIAAPVIAPVVPAPEPDVVSLDDLEAIDESTLR